MRFRHPGNQSRTCIIGATGSGKTSCALWLLTKQRLDKRPWIVIDLKREPVFDQIGFPPIEEISINDKPPRTRGLYLTSPTPKQSDDVERFLERVFERGNTGLFIDEAALMPDAGAYQMVLQQGRAKNIPVISCTQRPVNVQRPVFSEAGFFCVYMLADKRDYKIVEGFVPADLSRPLPPHWWRWYDLERQAYQGVMEMRPVPPPKQSVEVLRDRIPVPRSWHPFQWTARTTSGRPALKVSGSKA